MDLNVLGVSAGNGVILHPFKKGPFNIVGNVECRADYLAHKHSVQFEANFTGIKFQRDLYPGQAYDELPDIIVGHPKCGYSSMFALSRGKTFSSHKGEPSLDLYFKAIKLYTPKFFMFENLPGLLNTYSTYQLKKTFIKYKLVIKIGSVSSYGNSQVSRKRMVVIGIRKDIYDPEMRELFLATPSMEPQLTKELLADLPDNGHITEPLENEIAVYGGYKATLSTLQKYWKDHPDQRHYNIIGGRMKTAPGVYINREDDIPLTARKTNRQFNPEGIQMSPRELARIQGIPDDFIIHEYDVNPTATINKGRITVANTPPYEIGQFFRDVIAKLVKDGAVK